MPIDIQEDYAQPDGGYAILTLPKSIGEDDGGLRIKRLAGEPDKLGPKGWQPHDAILMPQSVREVGGKTELYFGPDVTQHLMEETELEISVLALKSTERVVWPYITPSVHADASRGAMVGAAPVVEVEVTKKPVEPVTQPGDGAGTDGPGEDTTIVDPPRPGIDEDEDVNTGFNWLWLIPIAAVAAIVVFLVLPIEQVTTPELDPVVEEEITDAQEEEEAPAPVPEVVDTLESLMAEATACVAEGCDGEVFFDIANRLEAIGVGDLFAIMGLAADNGSVPAMEWLARSYDPLHFEANEGLSNPDLGSAFLYYGQAEDAGSELAGSAKSALCDALAAPDAANWNAAPSDDDIRTALERNCQ